MSNIKEGIKYHEEELEDALEQNITCFFIILSFAVM